MTIDLVSATGTHREFVRTLSAEVFSRFGDYDVTLPPLIGLPWIQTVIAHVEGRPVGFAMFSPENLADGETDLLAIAVVDSWQRKGVGRRLLEHVEEQARALLPGRPARVRLTVAEDNERARRLFERAGFSALADEPATYPHGQRSIQMCKDLG